MIEARRSHRLCRNKKQSYKLRLAGLAGSETTLYKKRSYKLRLAELNICVYTLRPLQQLTILADPNEKQKSFNQLFSPWRTFP